MSHEASKEIPVGIVVPLEVLLEELSGWLMLRQEDARWQSYKWYFPS